MTKFLKCNNCGHIILADTGEYEGKGNVSELRCMKAVGVKICKGTYSIISYDEAYKTLKHNFPQENIDKFMEDNADLLDFEVTITETLNRTVKVKAADRESAFNIISQKLKDEEIVLDYDDFESNEINVKEV